MNISNQTISQNLSPFQSQYKPWVYVLIGALSIIILGLIVWGGYKIFSQPKAQEEIPPNLPLEKGGEEIPVPAEIIEDKTEKGAEVSKINIYLTAVGDKGKSGKYIGCGDSIVAVGRNITPTVAPLRAALNELLSLKNKDFGESGLYNALYQSNLTLENVSISNGKATISLSGTIISSGTCDDPRIDAQIVETAKQFSTVNEVAILLNGSEENYKRWLSSGKDIIKDNCNNKFGISSMNFKCPDNFSIEIKQGDHPNYPQGSFLKAHGGVNASAPISIVAILPQSSYPNTNFVSAWLAVAYDPIIANNTDCRDFEKNGNVQQLPQTQIVNGITWFKGTTGGAAAGTTIENRVYHTLHNEICYEIDLNLATTGVGKAVNTNDVWEKLNSVFSTFLFVN